MGLMEGFFNILNKTIQLAPRTDVLKHTRQLFELFMNAFSDIARVHAVIQCDMYWVNNVSNPSLDNR